MNCVLLLVGVIVPSNKRFAFLRSGLRCFPNEPEWILLLLFTFSSFPFTSSDRVRLQLGLGYFYFCRFLLLWGGSNSNWTSASGLARDRWELGLQMVRGSLGGRETTWGSKDSGFASMTLLSSPRLSACLRSLSASSPARELFCLPDMINGPGPRQIARFWVHSAVSGGELCFSLSSGGQMKSQLELTTGMRGAHLFHRSALDCQIFSALAIKGPPFQISSFL